MEGNYMNRIVRNDVADCLLDRSWIFRFPLFWIPPKIRSHQNYVRFLDTIMPHRALDGGRSKSKAVTTRMVLLSGSLNLERQFCSRAISNPPIWLEKFVFVVRIVGYLELFMDIWSNISGQTKQWLLYFAKVYARWTPRYPNPRGLVVAQIRQFR